jgi:hypothetical protein
MEMQQYDQSQKMGDMQQSFNAVGLDQINHNLMPADKTEMPEPGEGEEQNGGIINPEIPDGGDPTPEEKPIVS